MPEAATENRVHILLVEDDVATQRIFSRVLMAAGIEVRIAASVAAAIEELALKPALMVLDLILPDGSGLDVLKSLKSLKYPCRVAVVSGTNDASLWKAIQTYTPDAIFGKPLDFDDFINWICQETPSVLSR